MTHHTFHRLSPRQKKELVVWYLKSQFGDCKDEDFEPSCVCCQASHVRRLIMDEKTDNARDVLGGISDKIHQAETVSPASPPPADWPGFRA